MPHSHHLGLRATVLVVAITTLYAAFALPVYTHLPVLRFTRLPRYRLRGYTHARFTVRYLTTAFYYLSLDYLTLRFWFSRCWFGCRSCRLRLRLLPLRLPVYARYTAAVYPSTLRYTCRLRSVVTLPCVHAVGLPFPYVAVGHYTHTRFCVGLHTHLPGSLLLVTTLFARLLHAPLRLRLHARSYAVYAVHGGSTFTVPPQFCSWLRSATARTTAWFHAYGYVVPPFTGCLCMPVAFTTAYRLVYLQLLRIGFVWLVPPPHTHTCMPAHGYYVTVPRYLHCTPVYIAHHAHTPAYLVGSTACTFTAHAVTFAVVPFYAPVPATHTTRYGSAVYRLRLRLPVASWLRWLRFCMRYLTVLRRWLLLRIALRYLHLHGSRTTYAVGYAARITPRAVYAHLRLPCRFTLPVGLRLHAHGYTTVHSCVLLPAFTTFYAYTPAAVPHLPHCGCICGYCLPAVAPCPITLHVLPDATLFPPTLRFHGLPLPFAYIPYTFCLQFYTPLTFYGYFTFTVGYLLVAVTHARFTCRLCRGYALPVWRTLVTPHTHAFTCGYPVTPRLVTILQLLPSSHTGYVTVAGWLHIRSVLPLHTHTTVTVLLPVAFGYTRILVAGLPFPALVAVTGSLPYHIPLPLRFPVPVTRTVGYVALYTTFGYYRLVRLHLYCRLLRLRGWLRTPRFLRFTRSRLHTPRSAALRSTVTPACLPRFCYLPVCTYIPFWLLRSRTTHHVHLVHVTGSRIRLCLVTFLRGYTAVYLRLHLYLVHRLVAVGSGYGYLRHAPAVTPVTAAFTAAHTVRGWLRWFTLRIHRVYTAAAVCCSSYPVPLPVGLPHRLYARFWFVLRYPLRLPLRGSACTFTTHTLRGCRTAVALVPRLRFAVCVWFYYHFGCRFGLRSYVHTFTAHTPFAVRSAGSLRFCTFAPLRLLGYHTLVLPCGYYTFTAHAPHAVYAVTGWLFYYRFTVTGYGWFLHTAHTTFTIHTRCLVGYTHGSRGCYVASTITRSGCWFTTYAHGLRTHTHHALHGLPATVYAATPLRSRTTVTVQFAIPTYHGYTTVTYVYYHTAVRFAWVTLPFMVAHTTHSWLLYARLRLLPFGYTCGYSWVRLQLRTHGWFMQVRSVRSRFCGYCVTLHTTLLRTRTRTHTHTHCAHGYYAVLAAVTVYRFYIAHLRLRLRYTRFMRFWLRLRTRFTAHPTTVVAVTHHTHTRCGLPGFTRLRLHTHTWVYVGCWVVTFAVCRLYVWFGYATHRSTFAFGSPRSRTRLLVTFAIRLPHTRGSHTPRYRLYTLRSTGSGSACGYYHIPLFCAFTTFTHACAHCRVLTLWLRSAWLVRVGSTLRLLPAARVHRCTHTHTYTVCTGSPHAPLLHHRVTRLPDAVGWLLVAAIRTVWLLHFTDTLRLPRLVTVTTARFCGCAVHHTPVTAGCYLPHGYGYRLRLRTRYYVRSGYVRTLRLVLPVYAVVAVPVWLLLRYCRLRTRIPHTCGCHCCRFCHTVPGHTHTRGWVLRLHLPLTHFTLRFAALVHRGSLMPHRLPFYTLRITGCYRVTCVPVTHVAGSTLDWVRTVLVTALRAYWFPHTRHTGYAVAVRATHTHAVRCACLDALPRFRGYRATVTARLRAHVTFCRGYGWLPFYGLHYWLLLVSVHTAHRTHAHCSAVTVPHRWLLHVGSTPTPLVTVTGSVIYHTRGYATFPVHWLVTHTTVTHYLRLHVVHLRSRLVYAHAVRSAFGSTLRSLLRYICGLHTPRTAHTVGWLVHHTLRLRLRLRGYTGCYRFGYWLLGYYTLRLLHTTRCTFTLFCPLRFYHTGLRLPHVAGSRTRLQFCAVHAVTTVAIPAVGLRFLLPFAPFGLLVPVRCRRFLLRFTVLFVTRYYHSSATRPLRFHVLPPGSATPAFTVLRLPVVAPRSLRFTVTHTVAHAYITLVATHVPLPHGCTRYLPAFCHYGSPHATAGLPRLLFCSVTFTGLRYRFACRFTAHTRFARFCGSAACGLRFYTTVARAAPHRTARTLRGFCYLACGYAHAHPWFTRLLPVGYARSTARFYRFTRTARLFTTHTTHTCGYRTTRVGYRFTTFTHVVVRTVRLLHPVHHTARLRGWFSLVRLYTVAVAVTFTFTVTFAYTGLRTYIYVCYRLVGYVGLRLRLRSRLRALRTRSRCPGSVTVYGYLLRGYLLVTPVYITHTVVYVYTRLQLVTRCVARFVYTRLRCYTTRGLRTHIRSLDTRCC